MFNENGIVLWVFYLAVFGVLCYGRFGGAFWFLAWFLVFWCFGCLVVFWVFFYSLV